MPELPVIPADTVFHVGTLDPGLRGSQHAVSYEGAGLSVSTCPDAWRSMASLRGPTLALTLPGATWLDLASLDPAARALAVSHAEAEGLVETVDAWLGWYCEEGRDGWHPRVARDREAATKVALGWSDHVGEPPATVEELLGRLPEGTPAPPGALVERVPVPLLTDAGNARSLGFGRRVPATDMAAMFWVEDVLAPLVDGLAGVWWRTRLDVRHDLAPRGAIVPSKVGAFAVSPAAPGTDTVRMRNAGPTRWLQASPPSTRSGLAA